MMIDYFVELNKAKKILADIQKCRVIEIEKCQSVIDSLIDFNNGLSVIKKFKRDVIDIPIYTQIFENLKQDIKKFYDKLEFECMEAIIFYRQHNIVCERCCGMGKVNAPRATAECDREIMNCPDCSGSGKVQTQK